MSLQSGDKTSGFTSIFNPLDHPICFAFPLRIAMSAWLGHVPFAMFLIDILRPKVLVELGTHYGVSYCAFCQAVKALKTNTLCYAVDTWQGDEHSGLYEAEVLSDLQAHHDPLYNGFSRLIQSTFDDSLEHFADNSIDLLHIDGLHTYESVKHDFDRWMPKMSHKGTILFHDVNVREKDFGVRKLWDEIKREHPNFEFTHSHGLGVLAIGQEYEEYSDCLKRFFECSQEESSLIKEFFQQLGLRLELSHQLKQERSQHEALINPHLQDLEDLQNLKHQLEQDLTLKNQQLDDLQLRLNITLESSKEAEDLLKEQHEVSTNQYLHDLQDLRNLKHELEQNLTLKNQQICDLQLQLNIALDGNEQAKKLLKEQQKQQQSSEQELEIKEQLINEYQLQLRTTSEKLQNLQQQFQSNELPFKSLTNRLQPQLITSLANGNSTRQNHRILETHTYENEKYSKKMLEDELTQLSKNRLFDDIKQHIEQRDLYTEAKDLHLQEAELKVKFLSKKIHDLKRSPAYGIGWMLSLPFTLPITISSSWKKAISLLVNKKAEASYLYRKADVRILEKGIKRKVTDEVTSLYKKANLEVTSLHKKIDFEFLKKEIKKIIAAVKNS